MELRKEGEEVVKKFPEPEAAGNTLGDIDEKELERLAVESLLADARRGKARAERVGTVGWIKQKQVNKRFLNNIVLQSVSAGKRAERKFQGTRTTSDSDGSRKRVRDEEDIGHSDSGVRKRVRYEEDTGDGDGGSRKRVRDEDTRHTERKHRATRDSGGGRKRAGDEAISVDGSTFIEKKKVHNRDRHKPTEA